MKTKRVAFYCIAILMSGCVPVVSLQPLFTAETVVYNAQLLGTWTGDGGDDMAWEFAPLEPAATDQLPDALKGVSPKAYRLNLRDKDGLKGAFVAAMVKLQGQLYLDIFPDKLPSGNTDPEQAKLPFNAFLTLPAHTFVKINLTENQLTMKLTEDEKMQTLLGAEPKAISNTSVDDKLILTASTKDLQTFVTKYSDDERLFDNTVTLTRKRP